MKDGNGNFPRKINTSLLHYITQHYIPWSRKLLVPLTLRLQYFPWDKFLGKSTCVSLAERVTLSTSMRSFKFLYTVVHFVFRCLGICTALIFRVIQFQQVHLNEPPTPSSETSKRAKRRPSFEKLTCEDMNILSACVTRVHIRAAYLYCLLSITKQQLSDLLKSK